MCAAQWLLQHSVNLLFCCCEFYVVGGRDDQKKKKTLSELLSPYIPPCVPNTPFGCVNCRVSRLQACLCVLFPLMSIHTIRRYVNKKVRLCASIRPRLMLDFKQQVPIFEKKGNVPTTAQTVRAQEKADAKLWATHKTHIMLIFFSPDKANTWSGPQQESEQEREKKTHLYSRDCEEPDFKSMQMSLHVC